MPLNFPSSPVNNDEYTDVTTGNKYVYVSAYGVWRSVATAVGYSGSQGDIGYTGSVGYTGSAAIGASVTTSASVPSSPNPGDLWWDETSGRLKVYYDDGTSSQWVDATSSAIGYTGSVGTAGYAGSVGYTGSKGTAGSAAVTTSSAPPEGATDGDLWWDEETGSIYVYYNDGTSSQWISAIPTAGGPNNVDVSESPPSNAVNGDLWWNSETGDLYVYYSDGNSSQWVPAASPYALDPITLDSLNNRVGINVAAPTVALDVSGNVKITGTANIVGQFNIDNVRIDNTTVSANLTNANLSLSANGTGKVVATSVFAPNANATLDLGATSLRWSTIYGVSTTAVLADLAECYETDQNYEVGTVVSFGGNHDITATAFGYDTRIAGVISDKPAYLMNHIDKTNMLPVALTGKVKCWVVGAISKGDILVSSDTLGTAQRLDFARFIPGCVIGKSLEDDQRTAKRLIWVSVGRF